jgi:hypothetical protein
MELVADGVEVGLEIGIGADGRAFRPAITTAESLDGLAPADCAAVTTSSALAMQFIPNTARRTMANFRMLFYPDSMAISPAKRKSQRLPEMQPALDENLR